jgi:hypothetical protein
MINRDLQLCAAAPMEPLPSPPAKIKFAVPAWLLSMYPLRRRVL